MKFGYTILYVPDVPATLRFYEAAFGLKTRFLHEGGDYGELETGSTAEAARDICARKHEKTTLSTRFNGGNRIACKEKAALGGLKHVGMYL